MALHNEVAAFTRAIVAEWSSLMGGVASLGIAIYLQLSGRPAVGPMIFWGLGAAFAFVACFRAWRAQYKKHTPGLSLAIENVGVGYHPGEESSAAILLFVRASNIGSPSVLDDFELAVRLPGAPDEIHAETTVIDPSKPITADVPAGVSAEFSQEDWLYKKAIKPLQEGQKIRGLLAFQLHGVTHDKAYQVGTEYRLIGRDVLGNPVSALFVMRGSESGIPWRPGLEVPRLLGAEKEDAGG